MSELTFSDVEAVVKLINLETGLNFQKPEIEIAVNKFPTLKHYDNPHLLHTYIKASREIKYTLSWYSSPDTSIQWRGNTIVWYDTTIQWSCTTKIKPNEDVETVKNDLLIKINQINDLYKQS